MTRQAELHNRLAGQIVASIVRPPIQAGGSHTDVLVLMESVVVGVMLTCAKLGGDEIVLDVVVDGIKQRLAEARLGPLEPGGHGMTVHKTIECDVCKAMAEDTPTTEWGRTVTVTIHVDGEDILASDEPVDLCPQCLKKLITLCDPLTWPAPDHTREAIHARFAKLKAEAQR